MIQEIIEYIITLLLLIGFIVCYAFGDIYAILYIVISLIITLYLHRRGVKKLFLLIIKSIDYNEKDSTTASQQENLKV